MDAAAARSLALLQGRAASLSFELQRTLDASPAAPGLAAACSMITTGVGASEGPARLLASLAAARGVRASYTPLSSFAAGSLAGRAETLAVFSQGLSPNAQLVLRRAPEHATTALFTSARRERAAADGAACLDALRRDGAEIVTLPPEDESGALVRIVGPAVAALGAIVTMQPRQGYPEARLAAIPGVVAAAGARGDEASRHVPAAALLGRVAFVTCGDHGEACAGLVNKWHEGLAVPPPDAWDVLAFAHGPFQGMFERPIVIVTLEHDEPHERDLFDRLARMLVPARHAIVRLRSSLPGHLAFFDHDAQANALLLRAFAERPRDLARWPGLGLDAPLYELGRAKG